MPRVFTIPPDVPFLPALARAILGGGFPHAEIAPPGPGELPRWTILLPTRRAARVLQEELLAASGKDTLLMPAIRPIGDIDEEEFAFDDLDMPDAISALGREYLLARFVNEWAQSNPHEALAKEIRDSSSHTLALAQSLARLIDSLETEEATFAGFQDLFGKELSAHREAILGFLDIVRRRLPEELNRLGLLGPMERRSRLIDLAAERLASAEPPYPIIAAGSTGSIPATARLIGVISRLKHGAAVLPGLDRNLDDNSWSEVSETHPQFGLKRLLAALKVERSDIELLPGAARSSPARVWLAREVMRPKELTGGWNEVVAKERAKIAAGAAKIRAIAARTRAEEAEAIALIMRETLETPGKTAALVTPDRQLAARVRAALTRWDIVADDTAGTPLITTAPGSFLAALADAALAGCAPVLLAALVRHSLLRVHANAAWRFELAALRGRAFASRKPFAKVVGEARQRIESDTRGHPAVTRIDDDGWREIEGFAEMLDRSLGPLRIHIEARRNAALGEHVGALLGAAMELSDEFAQATGDAARAVRQLLEDISAQSAHFPAGPFEAFATTLGDQLRRRVVRASFGTHPRLSIYGLLEARLMHADTVILGGLNEGKWPAQPDTGPWLNRPMRQTLELQAPERDIGLTAHDFVQAFGNANVVLTWAARLDGQPALPSRWILRLKLLLEAIGMWEDLHQGPWLAWVRELDRPVKVQPVAKPAPRPPREARPKRISVSRVEELIRDPYSIYARQVLRLEPLEELGAPADARLRGELIHRVLELYHREFPGKPPADIAGALRQIGAKVFAPHRDDAEIAAIWLPRFERIAQWFAEKDADLREGVREVVAECMAEHDMTIAGEAFKLTGRADRIDILTDGTARILDFKTGQAPGDREVEIGLAPQLTLEAALLARGQFKAGPKQLAPTKSREIAYLRLTGGEPAGEYKLRGESEAEVMAMAEEHLAGLQGHLTHYADRQTPYLPRRFPKKENYASPYDHLSRFGEWGIGEARE